MTNYQIWNITLVKRFKVNNTQSGCIKTIRLQILKIQLNVFIVN